MVFGVAGAIYFNKKAKSVCTKEFKKFVGEAGADFSEVSFSDKALGDALDDSVTVNDDDDSEVVVCNGPTCPPTGDPSITIDKTDFVSPVGVGPFDLQLDRLVSGDQLHIRQIVRNILNCFMPPECSNNHG